MEQERKGEWAELSGEFYAMRKSWMAPLRLSVCVPILAVFALTFSGWLTASALLAGADPLLLISGGFLSTVILFCMALLTITMEAKHECARESVDEVLGNLMYTLESVRFSGPVMTEENSQSQIHVSEIRDCEFMAAAYIKTDVFGHDAFVDIYVPYSEQPIYSSDGRAVRSEAHGLRAYVTILPGENAKSVIDAQQQALTASGRVYEEGVDDELYREDLDAACKLPVYEENGQKRYAVLYADPKWEGYYLFREFTGLLELVDEDYPAVLAELERLGGLIMPALEALWKESQ